MGQWCFKEVWVDKKLMLSCVRCQWTDYVLVCMCVCVCMLALVEVKDENIKMVCIKKINVVLIGKRKKSMQQLVELAQEGKEEKD